MRCRRRWFVGHSVRIPFALTPEAFAPTSGGEIIEIYKWQSLLWRDETDRFALFASLCCPVQAIALSALAG